MTYPTEVAPPSGGGRIARVEPGGPADRAGLRAGSVVSSVEGRRLTDVIEWIWFSDGSTVALEVRPETGPVFETVLEREWDEGWGLEFDGVVFDGIRECDNACSFCFVAQLPEGLRPSLYVRDDDYRLSFLAGNFVTLTNVDDDDLARIITQRLSPLHVSLHAVDADVRRRMLCSTVQDRALEHVDTLSEAGIELHTQIVLVPGVNDDDVLDRTLEWLAEREGVVSVGIVPVGVTRYQARVPATYDGDGAASVLARIAPWAQRMRAERGASWVYAADELYLAAGVEIPAWDDYDGFPQFENGIGMTRAFLDEAAQALEEVSPSRSGACGAVLVTGELFVPVLRGLQRALAAIGCAVRVLPVRNEMLGGNVTVAGLLAGADVADAVVADALAHAGAHDVYLMPEVVFNDDGLTIDDLDVAAIAERAGADVRLVSCDAAGLVAALVVMSTLPNG